MIAHSSFLLSYDNLFRNLVQIVLTSKTHKFEGIIGTFILVIACMHFLTVRWKKSGNKHALGLWESPMVDYDYSYIFIIIHL